MGAVKDFRTERVEVSYKRLKADWNKDKDVVGFWSQKVIRFNLLNHGESSKAGNNRTPASGADSTGDENWKWEDGKAIWKLTVEPDSEEEIVLQYEFRE